MTTACTELKNARADDPNPGAFERSAWTEQDSARADHRAARAYEPSVNAFMSSVCGEPTIVHAFLFNASTDLGSACTVAMSAGTEQTSACAFIVSVPALLLPFCAASDSAGRVAGRVIDNSMIYGPITSPDYSLR